MWHRAVCMLLLILAFGLPAPVFSVPDATEQSSRAGQLKALRKAEFQVGGASCVTCLRKIEHTLRSSPGVLKAEVNIMNPHQAVIFFDDRKTDPYLIWRPLGKDGYTMNNLKVTPAKEIPPGLIFSTVKQSKRKDSSTVQPPSPVVD